MILVKNREIAIQISKELEDFKNFDEEYTVLTVFGGVPIDELTKQFKNGVDIIIGTPVHVKEQIERKNLKVSTIRCTVIDEADTMLSESSKEEVEFIMRTTKADRAVDLQTLLFL